jgi:dihydroorotate dehydrogenase
MIFKFFIRQILFRFDAEKVHYFAFGIIKKSMKIRFIRRWVKSNFTRFNNDISVEVCGLKFKSPVGLAAGFDKNALLYNELACFGFGFIEIGTVTPLAQEGNPKPRLFRLIKDEAIINRMGFNNDGMEKIISRLKKNPKKTIIGGNIGKNKITPNENATDDYIKCFEALYDYVDYFTVNVSSPNTPGLRELQDKEPLTNLLATLNELNAKKIKPKPIFLKIAPDLTENQLEEIVEIIEITKISGIIATNTTIDRNNLSTAKSEVEAIGAGGLSGKPLTQKSTDVIRFIHQKSEGKFPIIAVGGIHSADDAIEKFKAGATLVQLYTGFVFEGPELVKSINKRISKEKIFQNGVKIS